MPTTKSESQVERLRGLGELVDDHARHRRALAEDAGRDLSTLLPISIVTAMVSPNARPRPSRLAPKMPAASA